MLRRGFLKHAVRRAVHQGGGIVPVAAALHYSESHVGRWNAQTEKALPDLEQALDLDDLSLSCGGRAEILRAMAAQLGHVVFQLPQGFGGAEALTLQLATCASEFGDVAGAVVTSLGDGDIDQRETAKIVAEIDDALGALVKLRALLVEEEMPSPVRHIHPRGN
jgi:hypothetical protein